jgi:hypothetical protein
VDFLDANPHMRECCRKHDECYTAHGCQANSWLHPGCWPECDKCNRDAAACILLSGSY